MQIFANPGSTTHEPDNGRTVQEVRIELEDRRPGEPDDVQHGVVLHVSEYRGVVIVTVTYGEPEWRPTTVPRVRGRQRATRPSIPTLVIEPVRIPPLTT